MGMSPESPSKPSDPNPFPPSFWLQCFTSLLIGQEMPLLPCFDCPLSEENRFCRNSAFILEGIAEKTSGP